MKELIATLIIVTLIVAAVVIVCMQIKGYGFL